MNPPTCEFADTRKPERGIPEVSYCGAPAEWVLVVRTTLHIGVRTRTWDSPETFACTFHADRVAREDDEVKKEVVRREPLREFNF